MKLDKIQLRVAPLSGRVVLARMGKDPNVALDKRDAMNDFLQVLTSYAFEGKMPQPGSEASFNFGAGDEQFVVTVKRQNLADANPKDPTHV
jgi:hypothetical protein